MVKSAYATLVVLLYSCILARYEAFKGWVDPDTKEEHKKTKSFTDGKTYDLVMSDEFEQEGRSFRDGHDPMWTAIDKSDDDQTASGRKSLHYYNHSQVTTKNGKMIITTNTENTKWLDFNPYKKHYETMKRTFKSGMMQSWNKFCFTGGILEVDVQFPGRPDVGGLWPAIWLLGNLGRATFEASTSGLWPWSYEVCDRTLQKAQMVSGCDLTEHYRMESHRGRGATEIDLIEVMPGPHTKLPVVTNNVRRPYTTMTLQVAPGIPAKDHRPPTATLPEWGFKWYDNLTFGDNTSINPFFYGTYLGATSAFEPVYRSEKEAYQADAISSMMSLTEDHFESMHTFRLEWQPGPEGYTNFYVDDKFRFGVQQSSLDFMKTQIPMEPSYLIINTAVSTSWGFPNPPIGCEEYDCKTESGRCGMNPGFCHSLPAHMYIDHVRVYQNKHDGNMSIGCNPKEYPTKRFIQAYEFKYKNLKDNHALKDVQHGGGSCKKDSDCGREGAGHCKFFWGCKCDDDWTGPNCRVPAYKNPFPDWDHDEFITFALPYFPGFLAFCAVIFIVGLIIAAVAFAKRAKEAKLTHANHDDEKKGLVSWL